MLLTWFLKLRWKEASRSNIWQRNLAANIGIGFLLLYMMGQLLVLGYYLDPILENMFPKETPSAVFNSVLLYYFLFDLFMRYMLQGLPTFSIESFLHLPVKRSSIVHYIMMRTTFHILNFLPLLVFVPFAMTSITIDYSAGQAAGWLLSLLFLILMNSYLATWLKRQLVFKAWISATVAFVLAGIAVADHFGLIGLTGFSRTIFNTLASSPYMSLIPAGFMITVYLVQYFFLLARMYPEEVIKRKSYEISDIPRFKYLETMGLTGDLMMLEMKLWLRHKRTKSMLYLLPIFLLYGFFFYPIKEYYNQTGVLIFVGIFMSGGLMMNYLNYAFGYESNYFDGILTRKIDMKRYIQAKLTIGMTVTTICFVLTVPYVFFGTRILLINLVAYLFNMGVMSFVLIFLATFNKNRMDLSKGAAFNYQGVSAMNWLILIPAFLMPVLIYAPFGLFGYGYLGLAVIGLLGIAGLLSRNFLVKKITENFFTRKYTMAEGFRGN